MNNVNWLKPGIRVKRWIFLGAAGILILSIVVGKLMSRYSDSLNSWGYMAISALGIAMIIIAFFMGIKSVLDLLNTSGVNSSIDVYRLGNLVYEKRLLIKGPKIVVIGGGTGLSTMLRGLKSYTSNITAIVTVADDGGSSGFLRETLGMLPPGDIRNCILALADTEPVMEELLQYRFNEGMLKGQSFGNLFLAAMNGISDNFEEAIKKMSDVLAVTGKVFPVTLADVKLFAELEDGIVIEGESNIPKREGHKDAAIKRVFLKPEKVSPLEEAISAIDEADAIILGPGSLYTSIIPNLLVEGITEHIVNSDAMKIYVSNIMTQPGETTGYSVSDHINAIIKHSCNGIIDHVIINNGEIPKWLYGKYIEDGASEVLIDREKILDMDIDIVEDNLVYIYKNLVRHNSGKLAYIIMELILNKKLYGDKKRTIEFYYLNERLKEKIR